MTRNLTAGPPTRLIVLFTLPLLVGNVFQQLYQFTDAAVVGRLVGLDGLASVGATNGLVFLLIGFTWGSSAGLAIPTARAFGAGDMTAMRRFVAAGAYVSAALAAIIMVVGTLAAVGGGVVASGVMLSVVLLPPASLSAEIAQTRDVGSAPLFAGADVVALATHGDTAKFGVGDWASVFATATNPDAFEGDAVTLTGFVTPLSSGGGFQLTRLVITHCVIDAQPASIPVAAAVSTPRTGKWVEISGTVRSTASGRLEIAATTVKDVAEPRDPYEY